MTSSITPPITLFGQITEIHEHSIWTEGSVDDVWYNTAYSWTVRIELFGPQTHSSPFTRTPLAYTAADIKVGMWVADITSGKAVRIVYIASQDDNEVMCRVEDIERYNQFTDPSQMGFGGVDGDCIIFELNDDGEPILTPLAPSAEHLIPTPTLMTDIESRFRHRNLNKDFRRVFQPNHQLVVGQPVIMQPDGMIVPASTDTEGRVIGVVSSANLPSENWFTYRPIGRVIETDYVMPRSVGAAPVC